MTLRTKGFPTKWSIPNTKYNFTFVDLKKWYIGIKRFWQTILTTISYFSVLGDGLLLRRRPVNPVEQVRRPVTRGHGSVLHHRDDLGHRLHPPTPIRPPRHQARQRAAGRQRSHPTRGFRILSPAQSGRNRSKQCCGRNAGLHFAGNFKGEDFFRNSSYSFYFEYSTLTCLDLKSYSKLCAKCFKTKIVLLLVHCNLPIEDRNFYSKNWIDLTYFSFC